MSHLNTQATNEEIKNHFRAKAEAIVGERRVECAKWAHEAKIQLIANALHDAFIEGVHFAEGDPND